MLPPSLCTLWTSSRFLSLLIISRHPYILSDFVRNAFSFTCTHVDLLKQLPEVYTACEVKHIHRYSIGYTRNWKVSSQLEMQLSYNAIIIFGVPGSSMQLLLGD